MLAVQHLANLRESIIDWSMPIAACYHIFCSSIFLNTTAEDAQGLEKYGNVALIPFQYVFAGHTAYITDPDDPYKYEVKQRFDYEDHFALKMTGAIFALPFSVAIGTTLKGIAYFSQDVRFRQEAIADSIKSWETVSNNDYYRSLGIDLGDGQAPEKIETLGFSRKPGEEKILSEEKEGLREIMAILKKNQIVFWADCGTCLGAYRYGGVIPWDNDIDLSVLQPDFQNVRHALNALDKTKYLVEDWSNRDLPGTYLRVYIWATGRFIDIYHYAIHPQLKTIQFILSNESSMFLPDDWKIRSLPFLRETPYEEVFPLKVADFDGVEIPIPNQTKKFLQDRYGENLNPAKIYNEKTSSYEKDPSHPYWQ